MWPSIIAKAKEGGLDVIQTYVFWNVHEPISGQASYLSHLLHYFSILLQTLTKCCGIITEKLYDLCFSSV